MIKLILTIAAMILALGVLADLVYTKNNRTWYILASLCLRVAAAGIIIVIAFMVEG